MTRPEIEAVAARYGLKTDGIGDDGLKLAVLSRAMPDVNLLERDFVYRDSAFAELARLAGFGPPAPAARSDAVSRETVVRLDGAPKMDAATATADELRRHTERARQAFKADTERAYLEPIGARADDAPSFAPGILQALAEDLAKKHRAAAGVPTAEEAAAAFRASTEQAWRAPTTGTTSASLLAAAQEISKRSSP